MDKAAYGFLVMALCGLGGVAVACSTEAGRESVGAQRLALAPQVSEPFEVEGPPEMIALDVPQTARQQLLCSSTDCMVFYLGPLFGEQRGFASAVMHDGTMPEVPRRSVTGGQILAAAARGQEFLIFFAGASDRVELHRSDDETVRDVTDRFPNYFSRAVGIPEGWVVIEQESTTFRLRLLDEDFEDVMPAVALPAALDDLPAIVPGDGQFLVAWKDGARRFDSSTGAALDSAPIVYSHFKQGSPAGVYRAGVYQLAYAPGREASIYGTRIAADGTVLDADDVFNEVSGAKLLCSQCFNLGSLERVPPEWISVHDIGGATLLMWRGAAQNGFDLRAARVNPATGLRSDAGGAQGELSVAVVASDAEVFLYPGLGMARAYNDVAPITISNPTGAISSTLGTVRPIGVISEDRRRPAVGSNGTDFLVAWEKSNRILATRVNATTGELLDDPPLELGYGTNPVVGSDGDGYLVTWLTQEFFLGIRALPATGAPPSAPNFVNAFSPGTSASRAVYYAKLTWNGKYYLLSWAGVDQFSSGLRGVRLLPNGANVDTAFVSLGPAALYAVVADMTPPESMRTFVLAYASNQGVVARRFRSESGAVISQTTQLASDTPIQWLGGINLADRLMVRYDTDTQLARVVTVDPSNGQATDTPSTFFDPGSKDAGLGDLSYDGVSLVALTGDVGGWGVRRFTPDFAPLDAALRGVGVRVAPDANLTERADPAALASNSHGKSLMVYPYQSEERMGISVRARLITNDGEPSLPDGSGDAGGAAGGGAGGAGAGETGTGHGGSTSGGTGGTGAGGDAGANEGGTSAGGAGTEGGSASGGVTTNGGTGNGGTVNHGGTANHGGGGTTAGAGAGAAAGADDVGGSDPGVSGGRNGTGGSGAAGSSGEPGAEDDGGCGCRMAGSSTPRPGLEALAFLAMGYWVRRRRRVGSERNAHR